MLSIHFRVVMAAVLMVGGTAPATSQQNPTREVTLVQLEAGTDRPAMVYRRATMVGDRDIIALAPDATADDLSSAFRVLQALRATFGDSLARDLAAAVRSESPPDRPDQQAESRRKLHGQFVSDLRRSQRRRIEGFGSVRALKVSVPSRKG